MQVIHLSNFLLDGKQPSIDGFGSLEGAHIDNHIDQGVQIRHGAAIADFGMLDAQSFGLTIDAFARGALGRDGVIERLV